MCDILEYRGIDRFIPDMICFVQISLFCLGLILIERPAASDDGAIRLAKTGKGPIDPFGVERNSFGLAPVAEGVREAS